MDPAQLYMLVISANLVVLCGALWVFELLLAVFWGIIFALVSFALQDQIRKRNRVRAKLIRSVVMALAFSVGSMDQDMETTAFWVALAVPYVCFWGKFTGGAELLRVFGMALFGYSAHLDPRTETYALATAVWFSLSFFDPLFETLERDGMETTVRN